MPEKRIPRVLKIFTIAISVSSFIKLTGQMSKNGPANTIRNGITKSSTFVFILLALRLISVIFEW
jgi:hypothetical protein